MGHLGAHGWVELEQLVGKLVFTCMVCRWGFIFIQGMLDAIYCHIRQTPSPHTVGSYRGSLVRPKVWLLASWD